jgi:hypothetical protein
MGSARPVPEGGGPAYSASRVPPCGTRYTAVSRTAVHSVQFASTTLNQAVRELPPASEINVVWWFPGIEKAIPSLEERTVSYTKESFLQKFTAAGLHKRARTIEPIEITMGTGELVWNVGFDLLLKFAEHTNDRGIHTHIFEVDWKDGSKANGLQALHQLKTGEKSQADIKDIRMRRQG